MEHLGNLLLQKFKSLESLTASLHVEATTAHECDKCKDDEFLIINNTAVPCTCRAKKHYRRMFENSGISDAFQKKTFDNFKARNKFLENAKNRSFAYVNNFNKGSIAFLGQVGSGKTHLSIAIANELLKKGIGVLYMQYRDAIIQLKQNVMEEVEYQRLMHRYKNAPVLLLDDLFKGKITESDINIIFEIINFRYLNGLAVIVSSEYGAEKLLGFDEAIGSRILEMCKGNVVEFKGQELNYRLVM